MSSTSQLDLLRVLGVSPSRWTFVPAAIAAAVAAPILAAAGTAVALAMGALVGGESGFGLIGADEYWREMRAVVYEPVAGAHILKYALLVNVYRSAGFMASTMLIAQAR